VTSVEDSIHLMFWESMYVYHACLGVCGACGEDRKVGHGVLGDSVEGEREEKGETTLTQYEP